MVTIYPENCSCNMPQYCCHILAVKTKLDQPLCIYKVAWHSEILNCAVTGSSKQSLSGSKRKYQKRNSQKKVREVIENQEIEVPFLMELLKETNSESFLEINKKFKI